MLNRLFKTLLALSFLSFAACTGGFKSSQSEQTNGFFGTSSTDPALLGVLKASGTPLSPEQCGILWEQLVSMEQQGRKTAYETTSTLSMNNAPAISSILTTSTETIEVTPSVITQNHTTEISMNDTTSRASIQESLTRDEFLQGCGIGFSEDWLEEGDTPEIDMDFQILENTKEEISVRAGRFRAHRMKIQVELSMEGESGEIFYFQMLIDSSCSEEPDSFGVLLISAVNGQIRVVGSDEGDFDMQSQTRMELIEFEPGQTALTKAL